MYQKGKGENEFTKEPNSGFKFPAEKFGKNKK